MIIRYCAPVVPLTVKRPVRSWARRSEEGKSWEKQGRVRLVRGMTGGCRSVSVSLPTSLTTGVGSPGLVLLFPCGNWSMCPFGVAVVVGGKRLTISEVSPGSARPSLSMALVKVVSAGAPMQAW